MGLDDSTDPALLRPNPYRDRSSTMRKRIWIPCFLVLAVCGLLLLLWQRGHHKALVPVADAGDTNQTREVAQVEGRTINGSSPTVQPTINSSPQNTEAPSATTTTNSHLAQALNAWRTPIEFYGRVVDESSNPVAGAQIEFRWMELPDNKGSRSSNTTSDSTGLFALQGAKGPTLSVNVSKMGYYTSHATPNGYTYSEALGDRFHPDAQNPVIFVLRRRGNGEPL